MKLVGILYGLILIFDLIIVCGMGEELYAWYYMACLRERVTFSTSEFIVVLSCVVFRLRDD